MLHSKTAWLAQNAVTAIFHLIALSLLLFGGMSLTHPLALLWLAILGIHVLEIPFAMRLLRSEQVPALTLIVKTLIFGFTWWLPRSRGIYAS